MGDIKDIAAVVYRDSAVAGVPASGRNEPYKPQIRQLFSVVDERVSGAATGLRYYASEAARDADTTQPVGTLSRVADDDRVFRYELSGWVVDTGYYEGVAQVVTPYVDRAEAAATETTVALSQAFTVSSVPLASRPGPSVYGPGFFPGWQIVALIDEQLQPGDVFDQFREKITLTPSVVNIRLRRYDSSATDIFDLNAPGTLVEEIIFNVATEGWATDGSTVDAAFPLASSVIAQAGVNVVIRIEGLASGGGDATLGWSYLEPAPTGASEQQRGYFRLGNNWQPAATSLGWTLEARTYIAKSVSETPAYDIRSTVTSANAQATGLSVNASGVKLTQRGETSTVSGTVTLPPTQTGSVVDEPAVLVYSFGVAAQPVGSHALAHANVTSVVLKDDATNAVIDPSTYLVNGKHGAIAWKVSQINRPVKASYSWSDTRYDTIYVDTTSQMIGSEQGGAGVRDATERLPLLSAPNRLPLFNMRVAGNEVTDIVPLWGARAGVPTRLAATWASDVARNRQAIASSLGRLRRGQSCTIANYSDSIIALTGYGNAAGQPTAYGVPSSTVPNGPYRDRAQDYYLTYFIGADIVGALPLYTSAQLGMADDGAGQVHTRVGMMWRLIDFLKQSFASTIVYLNFGLAGTTSGTGTQGDGAMNARNPTRLAALLASNAHLVNLHFGMNDFGSQDTAANIWAVRNACFAAGMDVMIHGVPRPSTDAPFWTVSSWRAVNAGLRSAAELPDPATGKTAAFFDPLLQEDDSAIDVAGIAPSDFCMSWNHPGLREHRLRGDQMIASFNA